jgi:hypothetical protein
MTSTPTGDNSFVHQGPASEDDQLCGQQYPSGRQESQAYTGDRGHDCAWQVNNKLFRRRRLTSTTDEAYQKKGEASSCCGFFNSIPLLIQPEFHDARILQARLTHAQFPYATSSRQELWEEAFLPFLKSIEATRNIDSQHPHGFFHHQ